MISNSYHDTIVIINGTEYNLFNSSFGLDLTCNRVAGWQLWSDNLKVLIGGEYNNDHFQIKLGETVVFDNQG